MKKDIRSTMRQWRRVNLDSLVSGYCDAALWSSYICTNVQDENGEYIDLENGDGLQFSPSGLAAMRGRVAATLAKLENRRLFRAYLNAHPTIYTRIAYGDFGHDLWLTENGHGAGFWDRGYLECFPECTDGDTLGDMLTDAVQFREAYLYLDANDLVTLD